MVWPTASDVKARSTHLAPEQEGSRSPPNPFTMRICDLCLKKVSALRNGPPEFPQMETCEECDHDLLRRLSSIEACIVQIRLQMRAEAVTEWRRERGAKQS
jgi:hypothetical protein